VRKKRNLRKRRIITMMTLKRMCNSQSRIRVLASWIRLRGKMKRKSKRRQSPAERVRKKRRMESTWMRKKCLMWLSIALSKWQSL
jgi:hypothetical protein